ncbi:MAG: hypothetical protein WC477_04295 [Patescibacteria group bacterium]
MQSRIYDGSLHCFGGIGCPVADYDSETGKVTVHDPSDPKAGKLTMKKEAWNTLLANATSIPTT